MIYKLNEHVTNDMLEQLDFKYTDAGYLMHSSNGHHTLIGDERIVETYHYVKGQGMRILGLSDMIDKLIKLNYVEVFE